MMWAKPVEKLINLQVDNSLPDIERS